MSSHKHALTLFKSIDGSFLEYIHLKGVHNGSIMLRKQLIEIVHWHIIDDCRLYLRLLFLILLLFQLIYLVLHTHGMVKLERLGLYTYSWICRFLLLKNFFIDLLLYNDLDLLVIVAVRSFSLLLWLFNLFIHVLLLDFDLVHKILHLLLLSLKLLLLLRLDCLVDQIIDIFHL